MQRLALRRRSLASPRTALPRRGKSDYMGKLEFPVDPNKLPPALARKARLQQQYGKYGKYFDEKQEISTLEKYADKWDKHKQIIAWDYVGTMNPLIAKTAYVAPSATVAGNVEVWDHSSLWYNVVVRGDVKLVRIGAYTNIQDNTVITEAFGPLDSTHDGSTIIGHYVTIGHSCQLRACTVEDKCIVGMNSILCEGSYMESQSILAANSVLGRNMRVGHKELWAGNPARFIRFLTAEEIEAIEEGAKDYVNTAQIHAEEFYLPIGTLYIEAEKRGFDIGYHV